MYLLNIWIPEKKASLPFVLNFKKQLSHKGYNLQNRVEKHICLHSCTSYRFKISFTMIMCCTSVSCGASWWYEDTQHAWMYALLLFYN